MASASAAILAARRVAGQRMLRDCGVDSITIFIMNGSQFAAKAMAALDQRSIPHTVVFCPVLDSKKRKEMIPSGSTMSPELLVRLHGKDLEAGAGDAKANMEAAKVNSDGVPCAAVTEMRRRHGESVVLSRESAGAKEVIVPDSTRLLEYLDLKLRPIGALASGSGPVPSWFTNGRGPCYMGAGNDFANEASNFAATTNGSGSGATSEKQAHRLPVARVRELEAAAGGPLNAFILFYSWCVDATLQRGMVANGCRGLPWFISLGGLGKATGFDKFVVKKVIKGSGRPDKLKPEVGKQLLEAGIFTEEEATPGSGKCLVDKNTTPTEPLVRAKLVKFLNDTFVAPKDLREAGFFDTFDNSDTSQENLSTTTSLTAAHFTLYAMLERLSGKMGDFDNNEPLPKTWIDEADTEKVLAPMWAWMAAMERDFAADEPGAVGGGTPIRFKGKRSLPVVTSNL